MKNDRAARKTVPQPSVFVHPRLAARTVAERTAADLQRRPLILSCDIISKTIDDRGAI